MKFIFIINTKNYRTKQADQMLVVDHGRIVQKGRREEIIEESVLKPRPLQRLKYITFI